MISINGLKESYFNWMCGLIESKSSDYIQLLKKLNDIPFRYLIDMDGNRESDGIDLRYRFGYENKITQHEIAAYLDNRPCSVLEMMVALAIRCEENIMSDPLYGNRTSEWFWNMVDSLGLTRLDDNHYNEDIVEQAIDVFLDRLYFKNGRGGLFTLKYPGDRDMRSVEIWCQMYWYLDERFK